MQLQRPIIFFDIESTGLNVVTDRIVELSYIKVFPDGTETEETLRFNPCHHISAEASEITGIYDEDVADCPTFKEEALYLAEVFEDCDLAGFNATQFDVPILVEEFARAGVDYNVRKARLIDVQTIFHKLEPRNLSAALRFYCGRELQDAHTAAADTRATLDVLRAQLERYPDELQPSVDFLADFSRRGRNIDLLGRFVRNEQGTALVNFGKHKGKAVSDVLRRDPGFYAWMMQGDFPKETKDCLLRLRLDAGL